MRSIKSSLDALLKRIEVEAEIQRREQSAKRLIELSSRYAKELNRIKELNAESERIADALLQRGVTFYGNEPELSVSERDAIAEGQRAKLKRFREMREQVIVRMALADDDERAFMVKYFFEEVANEFPSLKKVVSKMQKK